MMTQRRTIILLVIAVAVIAIALWVSSQRPDDAGAAAGQQVLSGLKPALNDVTELRIAKGDGSHVTLKKRAADWEVAERGYPADSGKVRKLLLDLGSLEVVEEKTRDAASYARLGVEAVNSPKAAGTRIDAVTPQKTYTLIVGKPSGSKSVYVRNSDAPQSYLASPQVLADADPKRWLDHTIVDVHNDRIKAVEVAPARGPSYEVTREKKEQTDFIVAKLPKGRELSSASAANPVAGELASFTLDDVRRAPGGEDAAEKPAARATFRTFDGLEVEVAGFEEADRHYVALTPRSTAKKTENEARSLDARLAGWQFEIPAYKYDGLFRPLEDLLKKPPEKKSAKSGS